MEVDGAVADVAADGRRSRWLSIAWGLAPVVWSLLSVGTLHWLVNASFGPKPTLRETQHVLFGNAYLLVHGVVGVALSAGGCFRALRIRRPTMTTMFIVLLAAPCLVFALCQLWAWALFVGWV